MYLLTENKTLHESHHQTWSKVTLTEEFRGVFNLTSFLPQYLITATTNWRTFEIGGKVNNWELMLGNDDIYTELTVCWSSKCFTVSWIERWHLVAEFLQELMYVRACYWWCRCCDRYTTHHAKFLEDKPPFDEYFQKIWSRECPKWPLCVGMVIRGVVRHFQKDSI